MGKYLQLTKKKRIKNTMNARCFILNLLFDIVSLSDKIHILQNVTQIE